MELKGEIGIIQIEVLFNKTSGTNNYWEENWLYCTVKGNFPGFISNYECNIRTDDFERCYNELVELHKFSREIAKFTTIEEGLIIILERNHNGSIKVTGSMNAVDLTGCSLNFNFQTDNFSLESFINDIFYILKEYPIIGIA